MNAERFSEDISIIKDAIGKLECLLAQEQKSSALAIPRTAEEEPPKSEQDARKPDEDRLNSEENLLDTQEEVFTALNEKVTTRCAPGIWDQVQHTMKANYLRDERRIWRQIIAAIRANDEPEATRLAKASGIPVEFLKS